MMTRLRIEPVEGEGSLQDWRYVHNTIITAHVLSLDEVRERSRRHRLDVAYLDNLPVGCSTVRPPVDDTVTATVIARVLPEHRGRGFGTKIYERALDQARALGAEVVETVVMASNTDGLRFALHRGFIEVERYVLPGDTVLWITLRRA
jgi:GNAT superfamily N-acetyltransferase